MLIDPVHCFHVRWGTWPGGVAVGTGVPLMVLWSSWVGLPWSTLAVGAGGSGATAMRGVTLELSWPELPISGAGGALPLWAL